MATGDNLPCYQHEMLETVMGLIISAITTICNTLHFLSVFDTLNNKIK